LQFALCSVFLFVSLVFTPQAQAAFVRVHAVSEAGTPPAEARQQAVERAFVDAVAQESAKLLPLPLSGPRSALLRQFLAPRAASFIVSYQEASAEPAERAAHGSSAASGKPAADAPAAAHAQSAATASADGITRLDLDIEVNRVMLRAELLRLGLLVDGPRTYLLHLGAGVAERDLKALADLNTLMGLTRAAAASMDITLERLPQGYFKAVLRRLDAPTSVPFAADGKDLPTLWTSLWGRLFSGKDFQPGGAARGIELFGFHGVEAVQDFDRVLSGWDGAVQDVVLQSVDAMPEGLAARWSARVVNDERLSALLGEALPARGLSQGRRPEALPLPTQQVPTQQGAAPQGIAQQEHTIPGATAP
jgi:hypothetical protein